MRSGAARPALTPHVSRGVGSKQLFHLRLRRFDGQALLKCAASLFTSATIEAIT
jgi:hypothetical protein